MPLMLTKPFSAPANRKIPRSERSFEKYDEELFNQLRSLRKTLADERDVPAYVVFSDVALRQMAKDCPTNQQEFLQISGVGSRKLQEFGQRFLSLIAEYTSTQPQENIRKELPQEASTASLENNSQEAIHIQITLQMFRQGKSIDQIASQRNLVTNTIYSHLEQAIAAGEAVDMSRIFTPHQHTQMAAAFGRTGFRNLAGAKEILGDLCDYGQLRLFRALHGEKSAQ